MKEIIFAILAPGRNKWVLIGWGLVIVGIILTPVIIGLPIMGIGFGVVVLAIMAGIAEKLPGGKKLVAEYKKMFGRMGRFVKALVKEVK